MVYSGYRRRESIEITEDIIEEREILRKILRDRIKKIQETQTFKKK